MRAMQVKWMFVAAAAAALAACGGGDDDGGVAAAPAPAPAAPATAGIDKYVGNWTACFVNSNGSSDRELLVITKTGDTTVSFTGSSTGYATRDCSGATTGTQASAGTATLVGTKALGAETVDKVNIVEGGRTEKQVFLVRGDGRFYTGFPTDEAASLPDAEGYPTVIDPQPFNRP